MKKEAAGSMSMRRNLSRREMVYLSGAATVASVLSGSPVAPASEGQPSKPARGPLVRIDAKPEPVVIDLGRTAVIVVDMQNDFGAKGGMFDRAGIDISMIQDTIAPTARVLKSAREAGISVVYLKMALRSDLSDLGASDWNRLRRLKFGLGQPTRSPDGREGRILVRDTWDTEVLPALKPEPTDKAIYKSRFSGFYQTELDEVLQRQEVKYLIFTGCTTSVCVESTLRDAMFRGYDCLLLSDCTAEPIGSGLSRSNHDASLLVIQSSFGWVSDSASFMGRAPL